MANTLFKCKSWNQWAAFVPCGKTAKGKRTRSRSVLRFGVRSNENIRRLLLLATYFVGGVRSCRSRSSSSRGWGTLKGNRKQPLLNNENCNSLFFQFVSPLYIFPFHTYIHISMYVCICMYVSGLNLVSYARIFILTHQTTKRFQSTFTDWIFGFWGEISINFFRIGV